MTSSPATRSGRFQVTEYERRLSNARACSGNRPGSTLCRAPSVQKTRARPKTAKSSHRASKSITRTPSVRHMDDSMRSISSFTQNRAHRPPCIDTSTALSTSTDGSSRFLLDLSPSFTPLSILSASTTDSFRIFCPATATNDAFCFSPSGEKDAYGWDAEWDRRRGEAVATTIEHDTKSPSEECVARKAGLLQRVFGVSIHASTEH
jgi:hypothetical protein